MAYRLMASGSPCVVPSDDLSSCPPTMRGVRAPCKYLLRRSLIIIIIIIIITIILHFSSKHYSIFAGHLILRDGAILLIVSWRSFPVKSADFSMNLPPENPSKFDFFPLKCREIGRFSCEF